jgi:uncharacterized protein YbaR (Trm112 family)
VFIELAEALDCPDCQAEVGLVAFVGDLQERRVVEGHLGCPQCGLEYPIHGGALDLRRGARVSDDSGERSEDPTMPGPVEPCAQERAMQVAALLGVRERADARMLLDEALATCAGPVASWGERLEVLALAPDSPPPLEAVPGVTPIVGVTGVPWPFRPGALHGVALLGGSPARLAEAERILAPGGRLAVFEPVAAVLEDVVGLDFEIHAAESLALVATRR